ncbi:MAG: phosphate acyltransferase [Verrucomicrobiota bacterium]|nr:phosphate acyltransferase [Limisphaera sp.]MDW8381636.1 phosphate acyltransferase [Verrucomicrobiota bacterium]
MRFIAGLIEKLQRHPKRIVFPEGTEPAVLQAARQFYALRLGAPIVLGPRNCVEELALEHAISLEGIRILDPARSEELEGFAIRYNRLRRAQGLEEVEAREALMQPNYFAAMMLAMHQADGMVSGATYTIASVTRPLFQIVGPAPGTRTVAGCVVVELEDSRFGEQGVLFLADCAVVPTPTVEELAEIVVSTARMARHLLGVKPRVALLSFSTKGSAQHESVGRVQAATALARQKTREQNLEAYIEGELQIDAALMPELGRRKCPELALPASANVLIFPELNSGQIAARLLHYVARAEAYGPVLLGLDRPAANVPRGSEAWDILGAAAIVGVQSIHLPLLYPGAGQCLPGEARS